MNYEDDLANILDAVQTTLLSRNDRLFPTKNKEYVLALHARSRSDPADLERLDMLRYDGRQGFRLVLYTKWDGAFAESVQEGLVAFLWESLNQGIGFQNVTDGPPHLFDAIAGSLMRNDTRGIEKLVETELSDVLEALRQTAAAIGHDMIPAGGEPEDAAQAAVTARILLEQRHRFTGEEPIEENVMNGFLSLSVDNPTGKRRAEEQTSREHQKMRRFGGI